MKIAYCVKNVSHIGGIPKVLAMKANALTEIYHHEIYILESDHGKSLPESAVFSPRIKIIDLNINYDQMASDSAWKMLKERMHKRNLHKRRLYEYLNLIEPDIVISMGWEEKFFLPSIVGRWKTVREFHLTTNMRTILYGRQSFQNLVVAKIADFYEFKCRARRFDKIVVLTEEDKAAHWRYNKKVCVIPNPQTFHSETVSNLMNKTLIAVGRLEPQKNYASLIRAFSIANTTYSDWKLEIYGEGPDREKLQRLIDDLNLSERVMLHGNTKHVKDVMLKASCFVLSSKWEGMPLVMIEAMTCGLPIVSYDCPCGPKDLITDGVNGFLVRMGDEREFALKMMAVMEHKALRDRLGAAAKAKSEQYNLHTIMGQWQHLFEDLTA